MRGSRPIRAALGIFAALSLGLPATASAALSYHEATAQLPDGQTSLPVLCPAAEHVTGGGVFNTGLYNEVWVNDSAPVDADDNNTKPDDGWTVTLDNFGGETESMNVYAICSTKKPRYRSEPLMLTPNLVECPNGTRPVGGGVTVDTPFAERGVLGDSHPYDGPDPDPRPEDAWLGSGSRAFTTDDPTGVAHAICLDARVAYRGADGSVGPQNQAFLGKSCKPGERLIGGGVDLGGGSVYANSMYPTDGDDGDDLPDDGFRAIVDTTLTFERGFIPWAVCI